VSHRYNWERDGVGVGEGVGAGEADDRVLCKTLKNFSTHTCTHSLAINLLFQQDKGDAVRVESICV